MDKTKKYILMCEKAEEIQNKKINFQVGDFLWLGKKYIYEAFVCDKIIFFKEEEIWLPRQDQLQGMINFDNSPAFFLLFRKINGEMDRQRNNCSPIDNRYLPDYLSKFKTDEQLWLSFVMKEKYNKTWDGKEWIK